MLGRSDPEASISDSVQAMIQQSVLLAFIAKMKLIPI